MCLDFLKKLMRFVEDGTLVLSIGDAIDVSLPRVCQHKILIGMRDDDDVVSTSSTSSSDEERAAMAVDASLMTWS